MARRPLGPIVALEEEPVVVAVPLEPESHHLPPLDRPHRLKVVVGGSAHCAFEQWVTTAPTQGYQAGRWSPISVRSR